MDLNLIIVLIFVDLVYSGSYQKIKVGDERRRLEIKCKTKRNDAVISFINVTSGLERNKCCVGKTPQLIAESLNCYWKPKCSINFPQDIIIMLENASQSCSGCIGTSPDHLILYKATCFTTKTKSGSNVTEQGRVHICDNKITGNLSMNSGLLISHPQYPWQYDPDSFVSLVESGRICQKEFWLTNEKTKLLVDVHDIDIAEDDFLRVNTTHSANSAQTTDIITAENDAHYTYGDFKSVEYAFKITRGSNGGRGFVLCFMMVGAEFDSTENACNAVMNREAKVKRKKEKQNSCSAWNCPSFKRGKDRNAAKTDRNRNAANADNNRRNKGERKNKKRGNKKETSKKRKRARRRGGKKKTSRKL